LTLESTGYEEKNYLNPKIGNVWISIEMDVKDCCAQFYKLKQENNIRIGDHISNIVFLGKDHHMLCLTY
jgi:hypothetical protein